MLLGLGLEGALGPHHQYEEEAQPQPQGLRPFRQVLGDLLLPYELVHSLPLQPHRHRR